MPILLPSDTQAALGPEARECKSRSLFLDRLANPGARADERRKWFEALVAKAPANIKRKPIGGSQGIIYAQLQSRLMVNMAGGVMENAGLCLDRFGIPYIPGSAAKGCARRMAIQLLLEQREAGANPQLLSSLLTEVARVFGWGDQDWSDTRKDGRFKSDFAFAVGSVLWGEVSRGARQDLPNTDHFAGTVSFLPAWPVDATGATLPLQTPSVGALELDVVTSHHPEYYGGDRHVATDDEAPIPVVFPAVAAGHVFAFEVRPMRNCTPHLLKQGRQWLSDGLSLFGLGAKTAAGYGWFDVSTSVQDAVTRRLMARDKLIAEHVNTRPDSKDLIGKENAERARRAETEAFIASLTPEQQEDYKLDLLSDDQFRSVLDNISSKCAEVQKAVVRALRKEPAATGSRRGFWEDLKAKANRKGGRYAKTEHVLRQLSKQMHPGNEGRMP